MRIPRFIRYLQPEPFLWISSIGMAICAGIILGIIAAAATAAAANPPIVLPGSGATVGSVVLEGFRDGALRGTAVAGVRLFARDVPVEVGPDGSFSIVHPAFRIEDISVPVPPGMNFVASRKGKKYYSVTSASGERIAPENRVYFRDSAAAEAAGFTK